MPPGPDDRINYLLTSNSAAVQNGGMFFAIVMLLLLIAVNVIFSLGSYSLLERSAVKLKKTAKDVNYFSDSEHIFSAMRAGATFIEMLTAAAVSSSFAGRLAAAFSFIPLPRNAVYWISAAVIMLLLSYIVLLFGHAIPEKAVFNGNLTNSSGPVRALSRTAYIFRPLAGLLSVSANALLHLFGRSPDVSGEALTEREILRYAGLKDQSGSLSENSKAMISNILEFSGRTADEVMTHRTEVDALEATDSVLDAVALSMDKGHSRIPVYKEDLDNILGVIYVKDLLKFVGSTLKPDVKLTDLMRTAYFVPESKLCSEIFSEMTARKIQIAVVVDEYGGTEGILTMEDLLESIVGNIQDEYDNEEEEVRRVGENRFNVDGGTPIDDISELVGMELPDGDYDTIAGLIMDRLGSIPKPNEHPQVKVGSLVFTVAAMDDRRIARVTIDRDSRTEVSDKNVK